MVKIKILFFADILQEDFDGAARTVTQLYTHLDPDQIDILFVCGIPPTNHTPYRVVTLPTLSIPFNNTYKIALPYFMDKATKHKIHTFQPDIIHITSPSFLGMYGIKLASLWHLPIISIYHTHFPSYVQYYTSRLPFIKKWAEQMVVEILKKFYNQCSIIYVPSRSIQRDLIQMGISESILSIWERGLDLKLFNPTKRDVNFIYTITNNSYPTILFASRLVWEKNLEVLIELWKDIYQYFEGHINLIVAGDGIAREELIKSMPEAHIIGHTSQELLSILYASCDVFVFTSITETYGNVVAEAMASGIPCVIANGGGSADFIQHGYNGFLVKHDDIRAYIWAIEQLLINPPIKNNIIAKSFDTIKNKSWRNLADRYTVDIIKLIK